MTVVPLYAYGRDLLSFRYVAACDAGEVTISHEHTDFAWMSASEYVEGHLNDAELARWTETHEEGAIWVLSNREGIRALNEWLSRSAPGEGEANPSAVPS